jgi:transposase
MARFDLSHEEWAIIEPLLPPHRRRQGGRPRTEDGDRQALSGIFYVLRTGCPWRDLPERYGPPNTDLATE